MQAPSSIQPRFVDQTTLSWGPCEPRKNPFDGARHQKVEPEFLIVTRASKEPPGLTCDGTSCETNAAAFVPCVVEQPPAGTTETLAAGVLSPNHSTAS